MITDAMRKAGEKELRYFLDSGGVGGDPLQQRGLTAERIYLAMEAEREAEREAEQQAAWEAIENSIRYGPYPPNKRPIHI